MAPCASQNITVGDLHRLNRHTKFVRGNMGSTRSVVRRYKWHDLTEPEKEAVSDAAKIAATRAAVGFGAVLTATAVLSNIRRGKPPVSWSMRFGSLAFFSLAGAYAGVLSAAPLSARRILSVPNSKLAEDLRIVAGDWQARVPATSNLEVIHPHAPLPEVQKPRKELAHNSCDTKKTDIPADEQGQSQMPKTWAYRLGLTKS